MAYNILIMGASYGSLLASKMMFGGHNVKLVCLPAEAELIEAEGFRVRMPVKGRKEQIEIDSRKLPGKVSAGRHQGLRSEEFRSHRPRHAGAAIPLARRARAARRSGEVAQALHVDHEHAAAALHEAHSRAERGCAQAGVYRPERMGQFRSRLLTLCSPDPQAIRPPEEKVNVLQVTLPTNFKVARFDSDASTAILRQLEKDIDAVRFDAPEGKIELPVKLRVHDSIFVPLAKWAMLLSGNYRCITKDGMRTAQEAVHSDIETSRSVYNFVNDLCCRLGAEPGDLVPFEKYAAAAQSLSRPASAARALQNGAQNIERADKLVQLIAKQKGLSHPVIDSIVALVDARLDANRKKTAA